LFPPRFYGASIVEHKFTSFVGRTHVAYWPIATDRILVADRRFRGITDMAGAAAGRTRTRMTQSGLAPSGRLVLPGPVLDLVAASVTADNSRRLFDAPNAVIRAYYRLNFGFRREELFDRHQI
jgi:hypothetical protein